MDRIAKMTPFKHWFGIIHDLDHLRVWGCQVIIYKVDNLRVKEERKLLVGYDLAKKGYKVHCTEANKLVI